MLPIHVAPEARTYYEAMTVRRAREEARRLVEEWDYEQEPYGYCHVRPVLARLLVLAESLESFGGPLPLGVTPLFEDR